MLDISTDRNMASSKTPPSTPSASKPNPTTTLLRRAHSPTTAQTIYTDKFQHKTLPLITNTETPPQTSDARARRREARNAKLIAQGRRRRKKPQPLSAADKRRLCIYDIPKSERKYTLYLGLHKLWCAYMREILFGWTQDASAEERKARTLRPARVEPQQAGAKLASADFHGAEVVVVRSRCVDRVGLRGIVVRDTMHTFEIVTKGDEIKSVPKEYTVFRFEVPDDDEDVETNGEDKDVDEKQVREVAAKAQEQEGEHKPERRNLVFELHGEQFKVRAPDRANKKFRLHIPPDL